MSSPAPVAGDRGRRLEHQERAYELQKKGAIEVSFSGSTIYPFRCQRMSPLQGMIKYTLYTSLFVTLGHLTWPGFR
jgi:hypothetical protein